MVNRCRDTLRRNAVACRHHRRLRPDPEDVPEIDVPLYDALATLPFPQRAAVVLRHYLGLTEADIAEHLGCPTGSVGPWIRRGPDSPHRRVVTSGDGATAVDEASDWTDPLLHQAGGGADLTAIDVGGTTGWLADTTDGPEGRRRSLAWSPAPGVVLTTSTSDLTRTPDDLVDLALATTAVPTAEWDATHPRRPD